ncbi:hypothetical protein BT96DRAFT_759375, partial [Gymnopus androsaceus JB14]
RGDEAESPGIHLHVLGHTHEVDTRELEATFTKVGSVCAAYTLSLAPTRESRLFGFVTIES